MLREARRGSRHSLSAPLLPLRGRLTLWGWKGIKTLATGSSLATTRHNTHDSISDKSLGNLRPVTNTHNSRPHLASGRYGSDRRSSDDVSSATKISEHGNTGSIWCFATPATGSTPATTRLLNPMPHYACTTRASAKWVATPATGSPLATTRPLKLGRTNVHKSSSNKILRP